jgi:hypothetical protein
MAQTLDESLQGLFRALRVGFYGAVGQISHPAPQAQFLSSVLGKKTKPDALNTALNGEKNG